MGDKNDIISKAYNEFYGSVKETFTRARKQDNSFTLADLQKWFDGNFVRKTNLRGSNSYIGSPTRSIRSICSSCLKQTVKNTSRL